MTESNAEPASDNQRGPSPALILFLAMGILGLIAAGIMILNERRDPDPENAFQPEPPRSLRDWQAAEFELLSLDGDTVRLSDFSGRPVFLNFWRTDCPPCVRELPAFQEFMEEQRDSGAVVLAVNQGERPGNITEFLDSINISGIPVLLDFDLDLMDIYPVTGLPTTYLIDATGMVRFMKIGEMHLDEMYTYLESLDGISTALRG